MNKKLKLIEVGLIGCGDAVTLNASDTTTAPIASYALDEFKRKEQMEFVNDGKDYFVPFHAVDHIEVTETSASTPDRPDPYGCEGGSDTVTLTMNDTEGELFIVKDFPKNTAFSDAVMAIDEEMGLPCKTNILGWIINGNEMTPKEADTFVMDADTLAQPTDCGK